MSEQAAVLGCLVFRTYILNLAAASLSETLAILMGIRAAKPREVASGKKKKGSPGVFVRSR